MLRAFANEVRSLMRDGVLSGAQGSLLISMAEAAAEDLR
jgi:hypothetical protein